MNILEGISPLIMLYFILYGGALVLSVVSCIYLVLRKGNAFAADITPPLLLRRWVAAFFAVGALGHVWWFLFFTFSSDYHTLIYVLLGTFDCVLVTAVLIGTMLSMLQDRRRSPWPFFAALIPILILGVLELAFPAIDFLTPQTIYMLVLFVVFTVYMSVAVKQYGRWLRDNYADLEHKEVWQVHTLLIVLLLFLFIYGFADDGPAFWLMRIIDFLVFGLLLWRVETLPQLEAVPAHHEDSPPAAADSREPVHQVQKSPTIPPNIGQLLAEHCVDKQLYLQHDLTLAQLAAAVGTNRSYLSQYISSQGMTYNAYINDLRINHFIKLYHEAVAAQQPFTAQQLAVASGYRSYSTFSLAFKQRMGQSVTAWMRQQPTQ